MSDIKLVSRREFVKAAGSAAAATSLLGVAPGAAQPAKRRYAIVGTGDRAQRHVGRPIVQEYSDVVEFVGLCDINPKRVASREAVDRRHLPDVHELRRDVRQGEARPADGDDRRRLPSRVHRQGARPRDRRHDRKADGHRRDAVPGRAGCREAQQPEDRGHLQLPLRAEAPDRQGDSDVGRDRAGHFGGFQLVPGRLSRRRLLPPLAPACGTAAAVSGCTRRRTIST